MFLLFFPALVLAQCPVPADKPPCVDGVDILELNQYISIWYRCSPCVPDLGDAINAYFGIYKACDNTFSFIWLGDDNSAGAISGLRYAYTQHPDTELVFYIPDLGRDRANDYRIVSNEWHQNPYSDPSFTPIFMGLGNHDVEVIGVANYTSEVLGKNLTRSLPDMFNFREGPYDVYPNGYEDRNLTYSFDYKNAHFIMWNGYYHDVELDLASLNGACASHDTTNRFEPNYGSVSCVSQDWLNWLEYDLQNTDAKHKFMFYHEGAHPVPGGRHTGDSLDCLYCPGNFVERSWVNSTRPMRDKFWSLLAKYNVTAAFVGHSHHTTVTWVNDVYYGKGALYEIESGHPPRTAVVNIDRDDAVLRLYGLDDGIHYEPFGPIKLSQDPENHPPKIYQHLYGVDRGFPVLDKQEYVFEEGTSSYASLYFEAKDSDVEDNLEFSFNNLPDFYLVNTQGTTVDWAEWYRRIVLTTNTGDSSNKLTSDEIGDYSFDFIVSDGIQQDSMNINVSVIPAKNPVVLGASLPNGTTMNFPMHRAHIYFMCGDDESGPVAPRYDGYNVLYNGEPYDCCGLWHSYSARGLTDNLAVSDFFLQDDYDNIEDVQPGRYDVTVRCSDKAYHKSENYTLTFFVTDDPTVPEPAVYGTWPYDEARVEEMERFIFWGQYSLTRLTIPELESKISVLKDGQAFNDYYIISSYVNGYLTWASVDLVFNSPASPGIYEFDINGEMFTVYVNGYAIEWEPPIGIPEPEFGIEETYRMYDGEGNRNPDLTYTQNSEGGYYTYYVDNTHPAATDTDNTFGTASKPRLTIARSVPEGSVVEIHGGPYTSDPRWNGAGTMERPIFYRGFDFNNKPTISSVSTIGFYGYLDAEYMIFENLHFYSLPISAYSETHHISIRNSEIEGSIDQAHTSGIGIYTPTAALPDAKIHNIVIYNNDIHNIGDWQASGDPDGHGIGVTAHVSNVWIVDNMFYHNSGNGVQVNAGMLVDHETTHHIYLGRNRGYENKQDLLWTKGATDVIFSQNTAWNHRPSDSSMGGGMGLQYGPQKVWFLFNEIYDCSYGIRMSTDDGPGGLGSGEDTYIIGNLIHDIHRESGNSGLDVWKGGAAVFMASESANRGIYHNTFYNTDGGVFNARRAKLDIANNIFSNVAEEHIFFEFPDSLPESNINNDLFDMPARIVWGRTGDQNIYDLASFNTAFPGKADGSLEADPLFADPNENDFRLQFGSPAIDKGALSQAYQRFYDLYGIDISVDIDNNPRPSGDAWDVGAHEYSTASSDAIYVDNMLSNDCLTYNPGLRTCLGGTDIAYNTLTEAVKTAATIILIRQGTYDEILRPQNSGTANNPTTFKAYQDEKVIITGTFLDARAQSHPSDPNYYYGPIVLEDVEHIVIDSLHFDNIEGWGRITRSKNITIKNCIFTSSSSSWIIGLNLFESHNNRFINNSFSGTSDNFRIIHSDKNIIEDSEFHHGRHVLLTLKCSSSNIIRNNHFYNEDQKAMEVLDCEQPTMFDHYNIPYYQDVEIMNSAKNNLIEKNTFAYTAPDDGDGPFNHIQYAGQNGIIRNNLFYDSNGVALGMTIYGVEASYNEHNRMYNNVFYNNIGGIITSRNYGEYIFSDNIFKNNIIYKNSPISLGWADNYPSGSQISHRAMQEYEFVNNNILNENPGEPDVIYDSYNHRIALSEAETNYPLLYFDNIEAEPLFTDESSNDFTLQSSSPMIDSGTFVTTTIGAGIGTIMQVLDAGYFYDGYGIEAGDIIQLEGSTETATVTSIDYNTNTVTLDKSLTWTDGLGISLAYLGDKPDIGAYEYVQQP